MLSSTSSTTSLTAMPKYSPFSDVFLFFGGGAVALLLFLTAYTFFSPNPSVLNFEVVNQIPQSNSAIFSESNAAVSNNVPNLYDDPNFIYSVHYPMKNWDEKRTHWLKTHPSLPNSKNKILMVSGSQPTACRNPIGDHLLLKFFKNKVDYCRLHNIELFYNTALLEPKMFSFWAKIPVVRAAMVAHPEAEWIYWVDSDACFTDMDFELPLHKYKNHNMVLHGWPKLVYEGKSWTSLNAGVFLMRNCQWSMDFMDTWAKMGPQSKDYEKWGKVQRSIFKDKLYKESDDQTGIAYLMLEEKEKWADKIFLESEFYFEGYWLEIVKKLERIEEMYFDLERKYEVLRRRRGEEEETEYARMREEILKKEGFQTGLNGWRRPFVTHFTGCQPCSGDHNRMYSGSSCYEGMMKALSFADNQVLRAYGFRHERLFNSSVVQPLSFDFSKA